MQRWYPKAIFVKNGPSGTASLSGTSGAGPSGTAGFNGTSGAGLSGTSNTGTTIKQEQGVNVDMNDITSIVDCLESDALKREHFVPFLNVKRVPLDFEIDVVSTLHLLNDGELTECYKWLTAARQAVRRYRSKNRQHAVMCCNTTVELRKEMGSWRRLQQQHEHIEESLARRADVKLDDYSSDTLVDVTIEKGGTNIKKVSALAFKDYCSTINECIAKYDTLVRERLYTHKSGSEMCVRFAGPKKLYCLVCNCDVPYNTHNCYVKHVSNDRHKRMTKYLLKLMHLLAYHDCWSRLPPQHQAHQVHFGCEGFGTHSSSYCRICKLVVQFRDVRSHLESEQHRTLLEREVSKNGDDLHLLALRLSLYEKPPATSGFEFELNYDSGVQSLLYLKQADGVDSIGAACFQCRGADGYYCLLCNVPTTVTLMQLHVSGAKHSTFVSEPQKLETLFAYHRHWMNQQPSFQIHQLHFTPHSVSQTMCRRCSMLVDLNDVIAHLFTSSHRSALVQFVAAKAAGWPYRKNMLDIYAAEASSSAAQPQNGITGCSAQVSVPTTSAAPQDGVAESSAKAALSTGKSKSRAELDEEITNLIYPKEALAQIDGLGVGVQRKSPNLCFCLICRVQFPASTCRQHLGGAKHLFNSSESSPQMAAFQTYRQHFASQKPMIKAHQIFFQPIQPGYIQCIPCKAVFEPGNIHGHIPSNKHYMQLMDFIKTTASSWHLIDFCLSLYGDRKVKQPKTTALLDYYPTVQDVTYPKIFECFNIKTYDLVMHTVQARGPGLMYCLVCNCMMLDDKMVMSHCAGKKHLAKVAQNHLLLQLYAYHKFWMRKPLEYQVHQVFFSITNQCNLCSHDSSVSCSNIADHLQSSYHRNKLFDRRKSLNDKYYLSAMWTNIYGGADEDEEEFKFNFSVDYGDSVQVIYTQKSVAEGNKMDGLGVATFQSLSCSLASCLICQSEFSEFSDILVHIGETRHRANLQDVRKVTALHAYHDYWKNQEEPFQVHHIYFVPMSSKLCYCMVCGKPFSYFDVVEHLLGDEHRTNLTRSSGARGRRHLWKKQIKLYNDESLPRHVAAELETDCAVSEPTESAGAEADCKSEENVVENGECELEAVAGKSARTCSSSGSESQESESVVPANSVNCDSVFTLKGDYSTLVRKKFYPCSMVNRIMKLEHLQIYTIQCVGPKHMRCLLCQETITNSTDHVAQASHKKRSAQLLELKYLSDYHEFWIGQSANVQVHHSHFLPCGIGYLYCTLCDSDWSYQRLNDHLRYYRHVEAMMRLRDKSAPDFHLLEEQFAMYLEGAAGQEEGGGESAENGDEEVEEAQRRKRPNRSTSTDSDSQKQPVNEKAESHSIVKSVLNPDGTLLTDILEYRFHSHMPFMQQIGKQVTCRPCNVSMPLSSVVVREHLLLPSHVKLCNIRRKFAYECMVCLTKYPAEGDWQKHVQQPEHQKCCSMLGASRQKNLTEYHCINCTKVIFGDELSLQRHNMLRNKRQSKALQLSTEAKLLFKSSEFINEHCTKLVLEANAVILNQSNERVCCAALERCFSELFPDCKAHPFGSRVSGLGKPDSDLDVFIDVGGMYDGKINQDRDTQEYFVKECKKLLRRRRKEFSYINDIPMARTPIIQVFHMLSSLDCDLSFRHGLSVENTKFLRLCIKVQPVLQHTILILKDWLKRVKMNESISTYALCMMVIFYFQTEGLLLPVTELKRLIPQHFVIDGWSIMNCEGQEQRITEVVKQYKGSRKDLLHNFFNYYVNFDYKTQIVCPLLGKPLEKKLFIIEANGAALPSELLEPYINKIRNSTDPEYFRAMSAMCIQDPFDLSHNLTKACTDTLVTRFKELCKLTHTHLSAVK